MLVIFCSWSSFIDGCVLQSKLNCPVNNNSWVTLSRTSISCGLRSQPRLPDVPECCRRINTSGLEMEWPKASHHYKHARRHPKDGHLFWDWPDGCLTLDNLQMRIYWLQRIQQRAAARHNCVSIFHKWPALSSSLFQGNGSYHCKLALESGSC